ncbi:hypothetical protein A2U01_0096266, partial [Trifolium medium]|nr:hypothetical protein [Trifolium medium]
CSEPVTGALNRLRTDALAVTHCSDRVAKDFWQLLEMFAAWLAAATGSDNGQKPRIFF